jgi:PBP1b-binding outer membrane lipoprotein LpoB
MLKMVFALLVVAVVITGCVSLSLEAGDTTATYSRFGDQQITKLSITKPDGTTVLLEGQKSTADALTSASEALSSAAKLYLK